MRNGLMQEIISAAHEYEEMERENEELRRKVEEPPRDFSECSICEKRIGNLIGLRPFKNRYNAYVYVCEDCKRVFLDAYNIFFDSVNSEKGGE